MDTPTTGLDSADTGTPSTGTADTNSGGSDTAMPPDSGTAELGDYWEDWPRSTFFPTFCNECHPSMDTHDHDFTIYEDVVEEYNHIYCGVGLEMVPECEDHHEPGHLPQGDGAYPTDDERLRLVAWMDAGMPKLSDLE